MIGDSHKNRSFEGGRVYVQFLSVCFYSLRGGRLRARDSFQTEEKAPPAQAITRTHQERLPQNAAASDRKKACPFWLSAGNPGRMRGIAPQMLHRFGGVCGSYCRAPKESVSERPWIQVIDRAVVHVDGVIHREVVQRVNA